jgi:TetR/AcrR family transcriptional regulator, mexJK operon transcriptional repressor
MSDWLHNASGIAERPSAGRPTREQAEARHGELLDVALDLFLDGGYAQTTMEAVAAAVGMTKRTIYARYPDKASLFRATVQRAVERTTLPDEMLTRLDAGDLEATLKAVARMRVANVMTPVGLKLQRIINTESYRFPEIFTKSYEQGGKRVVDFLAELLRRHHGAGTVCVERPDLAANVFMSMVVGGPVRLIVSGNPPSAAEIEDRIEFSVRLFLNGVRPR